MKMFKLVTKLVVLAVMIAGAVFICDNLGHVSQKAQTKKERQV